jgi:hypothetical protein
MSLHVELSYTTAISSVQTVWQNATRQVAARVHVNRHEPNQLSEQYPEQPPEQSPEYYPE